MSGLDPLAAAAVMLTALAAATLIGLEVVRSVVDARRRRATGVGGTQDIATWSLILTVIFLVAAIACAIGSLALRWTALA